MLSFELSEQQKAIQQVARRYCAEVVRPVAGPYDRDSRFPRNELARAWEIGLINPVVPAEYGGAGLGYVDVAVIDEELAGAAPGSGCRR